LGWDKAGHGVDPDSAAHPAHGRRGPKSECRVTIAKRTESWAPGLEKADCGHCAVILSSCWPRWGREEALGEGAVGANGAERGFLRLRAWAAGRAAMAHG
jgi:hypothetical protein